MKRRNFISMLAGIVATIPFLRIFFKRKPIVGDYDEQTSFRDYSKPPPYTGDFFRLTCDYHGKVIIQEIPLARFFEYTKNKSLHELNEKEKNEVFWYFKNKYNNRTIPTEDYKRV